MWYDDSVVRHINKNKNNRFDTQSIWDNPLILDKTDSWFGLTVIEFAAGRKTNFIKSPHKAYQTISILMYHNFWVTADSETKRYIFLRKVILIPPYILNV